MAVISTVTTARLHSSGVAADIAPHSRLQERQILCDGQLKTKVHPLMHNRWLSSKLLMIRSMLSGLMRLLDPFLAKLGNELRQNFRKRLAVSAHQPIG
jgi:hypothetical protein